MDTFAELNGSGPSNPRARAADLHERMFGEKQQMDLSNLALHQQKTLADISSQIEKATINRARYEDSIRRTLSSAAAVQKLADVDKSAPNFDKQVAAIVGQYPEALGSPGFVKLLQDARGDRQLYMKAQATRDTATFNNPIVAKAYQSGLDQYGDPKIAQLYAKSVEDSFNKAKGLAANTDLDPQDRVAALGMLKAGQFDSPDIQNQLTQLDVKAASIKNARNAQDANLKPIATLSSALTHLNNAEAAGDESPELKDARASASVALQKYTGLLKQAPANNVDSTIDSYLGKAAAPAVTPTQAAGNPTEQPAAPVQAGPSDADAEEAPSTE